MRVGVFGGTFNPPHNGHKKLALQLMGRLSLDLLLIVPTYIPPHKEAKSLAEGKERLNMCRLCFDSPDMQVCDIELTRKGKSYTVNTLQLLKQEHPDYELFFLMGSDMLLSFHQWREPDKILDLACICAAARYKAESEELKKYVEAYFPERKDRFIIADFDPIEISSTEIREKLLQGNHCDELSESVENYIKERGLYT